MQLIFEYPIWFILFCFLAGALGSFALYWRNRDFTDTSKTGKYLQWGMAVFRFLSIALISFLLLAPFVKRKFIDKVDPVVVFVHDNTESMLLSFQDMDSAGYLANTNSVLTSISEKYDIDYFTFDQQLHTGDTVDFSGKITNMSNMLDELQGLYFNRNVGAVILASDGIYNEGINPFYSDFNFPIYTVAMGDTTAQKDLKVSNVRNNKIAYLDDKVAVEVDIEAYSCEGASYQITLQQISGTKTANLSSKTLQISDDYMEQNVSFTIDAKSIGIQRYRVIVSELNNEITYENNSRDFYIDVIDSRQKILLVANAPHPDIAALKKVVEGNKNYEFTVQWANKFQANLADYNLLILHQIPSKTVRGNNIIQQAKNAKIPMWYFTGAATDFSFFNQEQEIVKILPSGNATNDAGTYYNIGFNNFNIQESTVQQLKKYPPILVPFGNYTLGASTSTLLYQKIGAVESDFPVLSFTEQFGVKSAVFVGDGLWRWRMYDYLDNKNYEAFDELIGKTINYLAIKADKRKFRVNTSSNAFYEGEMVLIEAELYNDSYELINEPEATVVVENEEGDTYPFTFSANNLSYVLKTNSLPIGNYTYKASTSFNGKEYTATGAFSVNELQLEALQTKANHNLLAQLSNKTGGKMYFPNELAQLESDLLASTEMKSTLYETFRTKSIINLFWVFLVIMVLLSTEWFTRKYLGGY